MVTVRRYQLVEIPGTGAHVQECRCDVAKHGFMGRLTNSLVERFVTGSRLVNHYRFTGVNIR